MNLDRFAAILFFARRAQYLESERTRIERNFKKIANTLSMFTFKGVRDELFSRLLHNRLRTELIFAESSRSRIEMIVGTWFRTKR